MIRGALAKAPGPSALSTLAGPVLVAHPCRERGNWSRVPLDSSVPASSARSSPGENQSKHSSARVEPRAPRGYAPDQLSLAFGDILVEPPVYAALAGCDRLYHVASNFKMWDRGAADPRARHRGDSRRARGRAQAGVRKVVVTSSAAALGSTSSPSNRRGLALQSRTPRPTLPRRNSPRRHARLREACPSSPYSPPASSGPGLEADAHREPESGST